MIRLCTGLLLLLTSLPAAAREERLPQPPLPPPRPAELSHPHPEPAVAPVEKSVDPAPAPAHCTARLQALGYDVRPAATPAGPRAACHMEEPVALAGIRVGEAQEVRVAGAPIVECRLAEAVGQWVAQIAEPVLTRAAGAPLVGLRDVGGFECRNRNHRPDGKLSAHAQGLAIDIGGFAFANGGSADIGGPHALDSASLTALRRSACGWFLTVLGPGADPDHARHLHLDLQQHGSSDRYRICQ